MLLEVDNMNYNKELIVIRGGGDIASGIAHRLFQSGYNIIILQIKNPIVVIRKVAFAQAVYDGQTKIEGVKAQSFINRNCCMAVIDATLAKKTMVSGQIWHQL